MSPQARRQFEQWKREFSGRGVRRRIVPHHHSPSGKILKCPACGSTQDFVLYIESNADAPIQRVNFVKEDYLYSPIYLKCFAPQVHLLGRTRTCCSDLNMSVLAEYLKDDDNVIPLEDYKPPGVGLGVLVGIFINIMSLILLLLSFCCMIMKQWQIGITLIITGFIGLLICNIMSKFIKP